MAAGRTWPLGAPEKGYFKFKLVLIMETWSRDILGATSKRVGLAMNTGAADAYMGGRKGIGMGTILKAAGVGAGVGALIGSSTERFLQANAVGAAASIVPILNPIESFFEPKSLLGEVTSRFTTSTISRNVFAEIKGSSKISDIESGDITIDDILNTDY